MKRTRRRAAARQSTIDDFEKAYWICYFAFRTGNPPNVDSPHIPFITRLEPPSFIVTDAHQRAGNDSLQTLIAAGCDQQLVLACVVLLSATKQRWSEWRLRAPSSVDLKSQMATLAAASSAIDRVMVWIADLEFYGLGEFFAHPAYDKTCLQHAKWLLIDIAQRAPHVLTGLRAETRRNYEVNQAIVVLAKHVQQFTGTFGFNKIADIVSALGGALDEDSLKSAYYAEIKRIESLPLETTPLVSKSKTN